MLWCCAVRISLTPWTTPGTVSGLVAWMYTVSTSVTFPRFLSVENGMTAVSPAASLISRAAALSTPSRKTPMMRKRRSKSRSHSSSIGRPPKSSLASSLEMTQTLAALTSSIGVKKRPCMMMRLRTWAYEAVEPSTFTARGWPSIGTVSRSSSTGAIAAMPGTPSRMRSTSSKLTSSGLTPTPVPKAKTRFDPTPSIRLMT